MQAGSARIEVMRFSLLIVLTIALVSVAVRINSHSSAHSAHAPAGSHPSASPASPAAPTSPSSPSSPAQVLPTSSSRGSSTSSGSGGTGTNTSTGTGTVAQPQLPVTGWQGAVRLSALSLVLIGAGVGAVRAAGPRPRRR